MAKPVYPPRRRAPQFSIADVSRTYVRMGWAGLLMCGAGLVGAAYGFVSYRTASDVVATTEATLSVAKSIAANAEALSTGLESILPTVLRDIKATTQMTAALRQAESSLIPGPEKDAIVLHLGAWDLLRDRAMNLEQAAADADRLRVLLGERWGAIRDLSKRLDALNKGSQMPSEAGLAYTDALARIQAYTDSGIGYRSAPRVEYDLKVMAYQSRAIAEAVKRPEAAALSQETAALFEAVKAAASKAKESQVPREAISDLVDKARILAAKGQEITAAAFVEKSRAAALGYLSLGLVALGVGLLVAAVVLGLKGFNARVRDATAQFVHGSEAIAGILGAVRDIAKGDFSVTVAESHESTQEIAEAINQATRLCRKIVSDIDRASRLVDEKVRDASETSESTRLLAKSQEDKIRGAEVAVRDVVEIVRDVDNDTKAASFAAKAALQAVYNGTRAVQDSVEKMDFIRETIQETSKRMKRLGERSQEIGEVVEILARVAEQVSVLALNASLEASRAGDEGKGMRILAVEIQNLAVRTEEALKQIEALVATAQTETREAMEAMERSTRHVADGAYVTEIAGSSLHVIRTIMDSLASMVGHISIASSKQSDRASEVVEKMGGVLEITRHTAAAISGVAANVSDIGESTRELKSSVSEFVSR